MLADRVENIFRKCPKPTSLLLGRLAFRLQPPLSWISGVDAKLIQPLQKINVNGLFVRETFLSAPVQGDQIVDVGHLLLVLFQHGFEPLLDALLRPERSEEVLLE